jgi:hypothetical protein
MNFTKKSKKVRVILVETKSYYAKYICPSCHVEYSGVGVNKSTVSFKCDCGQVLVVESIAVACSGLTKRALDFAPESRVNCTFCGGLLPKHNLPCEMAQSQ